MTIEVVFRYDNPHDPSDGPVLVRLEGRAGRLTLNRPATLNALNQPMIEALQAALDDWRTNPAVALVILDGAGERGFCAGGDLTVVHSATSEDSERALRLWRAEYALDATIAAYPKPIVVAMDGITMGGGIGLGGHATVRVVTERSVLAMPEVAIGLAPDVGGTLLLSRAPGEAGTHVALTAARLGAADALYCGLADHAVASARLPALWTDLAAPSGPISTERIHELIAGHYELRTETPGLAVARPWLDACYAADSVPEILTRLRSAGLPEAEHAAAAIESGAPTAVTVTLRALRQARSMTSLAECLHRDYWLCARFLAHPDLREGIRAAVIDKDRVPRWQPATFAEVRPADIDGFFAPLDNELTMS